LIRRPSKRPIIGLITEDIYHEGRLIIPGRHRSSRHGAGRPETRTHRQQRRLDFGLANGEELHLDGIALDREKNSNGDGWGITMAVPGSRGHGLEN